MVLVDTNVIVDVLQDDPQWADYILFYEYFHGDNGAGLGASHQMAWTGVPFMPLLDRVRIS